MIVGALSSSLRQTLSGILREISKRKVPHGIGVLVSSCKFNLSLNLITSVWVFLFFSYELLSLLSENHLENFSRIGFRTWIILNNPEYKFEPLLNYFCKLNNEISSSTESKFGKNEDICLVLESKNEEETHLRLNIGPYKKEEAKKYFSFESTFEEGLILEISGKSTINLIENSIINANSFIAKDDSILEIENSAINSKTYGISCNKLTIKSNENFRDFTSL